MFQQLRIFRYTHMFYYYILVKMIIDYPKDLSGKSNQGAIINQKCEPTFSKHMIQVDKYFHEALKNVKTKWERLIFLLNISIIIIL